MLTRKMPIALALLLVIFTAACTQRPALAPIPPPVLPLEVKVPVLVPLPMGLTSPCAPATPLAPINTDADGAIQTAREKVRADCAEGKLKAIREAQPETQP